MATKFFLIGYYFEEFRSQEAIRGKKIIFTPCGVVVKSSEIIDRDTFGNFPCKLNH